MIERETVCRDKTREREREREMHREMDREREREQVKWGRKKRGLLLIANYPARQLHTIIWHARTSACPFTLRFAILGAYAYICMYMSVYTDGVSRVVEGRRNRCTRQRDADRRAIPLFFSRPLFCSSSSSFTSSLARPITVFPSEPLSFVARTFRYHCPISFFIATAMRRDYR